MEIVYQNSKITNIVDTILMCCTFMELPELYFRRFMVSNSSEKAHIFKIVSMETRERYERKFLKGYKGFL